MRAVVGLFIVAWASATWASQAAADDWSPALTGYLFHPPADDSYVSPILTADRGVLHLEGRYNYENLDTASGFVGWNLEAGDEIVVTATPILGLVVGRTDGAAPGVESEVAWRSLSLYVEAEHMIAFETKESSFFYAWIEGTAAPTAWLRLGLACQKTRAYETGLDVQRGPMVEASRGPWSLGCYWFNPDRQDDGLFVLTLGWSPSREDAGD